MIPYCWKLLWSNLKYTLSLSNPDPSLLANKTTCSKSLTFFNYSSNLLSVFSHLPCTLIQFAYPTVPTLKMLGRNLLCVEWRIGLNVCRLFWVSTFPKLTDASSLNLRNEGLCHTATEQDGQRNTAKECHGELIFGPKWSKFWKFEKKRKLPTSQNLIVPEVPWNLKVHCLSL